jgi:hypothetical protein
MATKISLSGLKQEFNTSNTGLIKLSNFYTDNALKLTSGQPLPLVASGNKIKYSLFQGVKYCYFQQGFEPSGATYTKTTISNQIFLTLNPNIKKSGKLGVLSFYFQKISYDVAVNIFVAGVLKSQQWASVTTYGLVIINYTSLNIPILASDTCSLQFTALATGRNFYMGVFTSGRPFVTLTIV